MRPGADLVASVVGQVPNCNVDYARIYHIIHSHSLGLEQESAREAASRAGPPGQTGFACLLWRDEGW